MQTGNSKKNTENSLIFLKQFQNNKIRIIFQIESYIENSTHETDTINFYTITQFNPCTKIKIQTRVKSQNTAFDFGLYYTPRLFGMICERHCNKTSRGRII